MKHKLTIPETINIEQVKRHSDFFLTKFHPHRLYIPRSYETFSAS